MIDKSRLNGNAEMTAHTEKALTYEAVEKAHKLKVPATHPMTEEARRDKDWIAAFEWYNIFMNIKPYPLMMSCAPCWSKVYFALKKAKE